MQLLKKQGVFRISAQKTEKNDKFWNREIAADPICHVSKQVKNV